MVAKIKHIAGHKVVKKTGGVFQIFLQIILFVVLPAVVFTLLTARTEIIKGLHSYVVQTGSMEPKIPVGSVIYTKKELGYKVGDVIAFTNAQDQTITHRITGVDYKESTFYTTKGDANNTKDREAVPAGKVVGKVYFQVPSVGYLMNFLKTPKGFVLFIILPVVLFVSLELWNIKKEMEKEIEKKMLKKFQKSINPIGS